MSPFMVQISEYKPIAHYKFNDFIVGLGSVSVKVFDKNRDVLEFYDLVNVLNHCI